MKKIFYLVAFGAVLTISSCKKDPCKGVVCYNGGTCVDGNCQCTAGWTGATCGTPDDPCNTTVCYNSGICISGVCNCQAHFFGDSCRGQEPPDTMYIYRIVVNKYSPVDPTGTQWDAADGTLADIFPVIKRNGVIVYSDSYFRIDNANHSTQRTFNLGADSLYIPGNDITNPTYRLELWDTNTVGPNRYMHGFDFAPYPDDTTGFPGSRELIRNVLDPYENWFEFRVYYRYGWQ